MSRTPPPRYTWDDCREILARAAQDTDRLAHLRELNERTGSLVEGPSEARLEACAKARRAKDG